MFIDITNSGSCPEATTNVLLTPVEGAKEQVKAASSASTIEAPEPERPIQVAGSFQSV